MANETLISDPVAVSGTVEVTMPSPGSDVAMKVVAWLKHPGDPVQEHDPICIVEWDEGQAEVGSPAGGVLRMVTAAAGQAVAVGATLAVIDVGAAPLGRFSRD